MITPLIRNRWDYMKNKRGDEEDEDDIIDFSVVRAKIAFNDYMQSVVQHGLEQFAMEQKTMIVDALVHGNAWLASEEGDEADAEEIQEKHKQILDCYAPILASIHRPWVTCV